MPIIFPFALSPKITCPPSLASYEIVLCLRSCVLNIHYLDTIYFLLLWTSSTPIKYNLYILLNPNLYWPRLVSFKIIHGEHVQVQFSIITYIASMTFSHAIEALNIIKFIYSRMIYFSCVWNMPYVLW